MSKCARERGRGRETWLSHALPLRSLRMMHGSICLSLSQIYLPSHLTASADDMTLDAANAMSGHYKGYPKDWRKATLTKAFTAEESAAHAAAGQYSPHHEGMRACPHATGAQLSRGTRVKLALAAVFPRQPHAYAHAYAHAKTHPGTCFPTHLFFKRVGGTFRYVCSAPSCGYHLIHLRFVCIDGIPFIRSSAQGRQAARTQRIMQPLEFRKVQPSVRRVCRVCSAHKHCSGGSYRGTTVLIKQLFKQVRRINNSAEAPCSR